MYALKGMMNLIHFHTRWRGIPLRVAADECGIRALLPGGERKSLLELHSRYPHATCKAGVPGIFDAVVARLEDPSRELPPLAAEGTPFQRLVWDGLCRIPLGATLDYGSLADLIGRPTAVRAVAAACAANPIAILIPCHRVIRKDGSISGYRWSVALKKKLLEWEGRLVDGGRAEARWE